MTKGKKVIVAILSAIMPYRLRELISNAFRLTLRDNGIVNKNMFSHINILRELGFNPSFIIDVGAYKGQWTAEVFKIFPNSNFLMIEPQESKEEALQKTAKLSPKIDYKICLVGDSLKQKVLFYEMETGSSIYEENTNYGRQEKFLQMYTLDSIVSQGNFLGNCFLKLDVQGAEKDVLLGAKELLKQTEFLLLEISTLNYNQNAPLFAEMIAYLSSIGFVLFDICDERRQESKVLFQVDMIFVKETSLLRKKVSYDNRSKNNGQ